METRDYKCTYIRTKNAEEFGIATKFYEDNWFELCASKWWKSVSNIWHVWIYAESNWKECTAVSTLSYISRYIWVRDITEEVLWKDTWWIEKYIIGSEDQAYARKRMSEINFEEPFFEKFLPFKKDKPMTLSQEIFDRFLKSNKTKVIEAVEKAESIQNEITPLLKPFNELAVELATNKKNLERAFDNQDKERIKFYLKELQEINSIFDDKLFDQLKTILKAINKSLSL